MKDQDLIHARDANLNSKVENQKPKTSLLVLEKIQFLLAQIESFVETEGQDLQKSLRQFSPATNLDSVESLVTLGPQEPEIAIRVLERLSPYFESGLLIQRGLTDESANWWITDLFVKGQIFNLDISEQIRANALDLKITPLQVHRAPAARVLEIVNLKFLNLHPETQAYLIKPTPSVAFMLMSLLPDPWAVSHLEHTHRLINKSFVF